MVLHLTQEQEARIAELAQLHEAALQRSLEQANGGEFIEQEEMDRRFAMIVRSS